MSKKLPETMFIRRPNLENLLRKLLLSPSKVASNIHTITGSVRALDVKTASYGARVNTVVIRRTDGGEITINDPTLVAGKGMTVMNTNATTNIRISDCSGDSQAGFKWLKKAGYDIPQDTKLEYDQKLYYVTITFTMSERMKACINDILLASGHKEGYDGIGWLYTFVPHYNVCNEGFVIGKMDNDTSESLKSYVWCRTY